MNAARLKEIQVTRKLYYRIQYFFEFEKLIESKIFYKQLFVINSLWDNPYEK